MTISFVLSVDIPATPEYTDPFDIFKMDSNAYSGYDSDVIVMFSLKNEAAPSHSRRKIADLLQFTISESASGLCGTLNYLSAGNKGMAQWLT